jgi:general secretion pathway protein G
LEYGKQTLGGVGSHRCTQCGLGFTLIELLVALAIGAILVAVAVPSYLSYVQSLKVNVATQDILEINARIERYVTLFNGPPPDLATVGSGNVLDPWGHPYAYLSFTGLQGKGKMRKDKNLVPINTQYDLYSAGADGRSVPPLTAKASRDDVVMANDGGYIGLASNY